jgi:hypothetical protein
MYLNHIDLDILKWASILVSRYNLTISTPITNAEYVPKLSLIFESDTNIKRWKRTLRHWIGRTMMRTTVDSFLH